MAQRKRSRNNSFLSETAKQFIAGESGLVGAASVCLMARETGLVKIFRNDFAKELIHACSHVIHNDENILEFVRKNCAEKFSG